MAQNKEILTKIIASLTLIVMVFYCVPITVIAAEIGKTDNDLKLVQKEKTEEKTEETAIKIVGEQVEKRTANEKHFLMSDGSEIAAVYSSNIHYQENGEFVDVDNTLGEKKDTKETLKMTQDELKIMEEEVLDKVDINTESQDVNTTTQNAIEKALEQAEEKKETAIYGNQKGSYSVNFSNKTKEYNLGSMTSNGYTITWGLKNSKSAYIEVDNPEKNTNIEDAKSVDDIVLNQVTSGIEYKNILSEIDLEYTVEPEFVKENIILNNKEAINNEIEFIYNTQGLKMKLLDNKDIIVYKDNEKNVIFTMQAPFMYDGKLEFNENIEMKLKETKGRYILTLVPDKEWLEAEERVYPVTIDPTIKTSLAAADIKHSYIYSGDTNNNTRHQAHIIRVGSGSGAPGRGLIKFALPTLEPGDQVISANLSIFNYPDTDEWAPPPDEKIINLHKMTASWTENNAHWSTDRNNYDTQIVDYIKYKYTSSDPKKKNTFDITSVVKDWYTNRW